MKPFAWISVLILIVVLLFSFFPALAQGIGQPLVPQPIGTPIPLESQKIPVWQAPWQPTAAPQPPTVTGITVVVQAVSIFYEFNRWTGKFGVHVPITHDYIGEILTVRYLDANYAEVLTGTYQGWFLERWALRPL